MINKLTDLEKRFYNILVKENSIQGEMIYLTDSMIISKYGLFEDKKYPYSNFYNLRKSLIRKGYIERGIDDTGKYYYKLSIKENVNYELSYSEFLDNFIFIENNLTSNEKYFLIYLFHSYVENDYKENFYLIDNEIGKELNISRKTVIKTRKALIDKGVITTTSKKYLGKNILFYNINFDKIV